MSDKKDHKRIRQAQLELQNNYSTGSNGNARLLTGGWSYMSHCQNMLFPQWQTYKVFLVLGTKTPAFTHYLWKWPLSYLSTEPGNDSLTFWGPKGKTKAIQGRL